MYKYIEGETWLATDWIDENTSGAQEEVYDSSNTTNNKPIRFQLEDGADVNKLLPDNIIDGKTFFQNQTSPRGATRIYPESYLIKFFDGANLSTLLHETGHVFFEEMEVWSG